MFYMIRTNTLNSISSTVALYPISWEQWIPHTGLNKVDPENDTSFYIVYRNELGMTLSLYP